MSFTAMTYRVLIASPSDLPEERAAATDAITHSIRAWCRAGVFPTCLRADSACVHCTQCLQGLHSSIGSGISLATHRWSYVCAVLVL